MIRYGIFRGRTDGRGTGVDFNLPDSKIEIVIARAPPE
eukprot:COSAG02_NODE_17627_length_990_cov_1.278339_2_plen_37_part_01